MQSKNLNFEKLGVYLGCTIAFCSVIFYIADMKERIAKLEVKVDRLEEKK